MEEGRGTTLEMTPLTQTNSLVDGGSDDDDEEHLAGLLEGSFEESTSARPAAISVNDGGGKYAISATAAKSTDGKAGNALEGTSRDATSAFDDSGAPLLENCRSSVDGDGHGTRSDRTRRDGDGKNAADHGNSGTRLGQSLRPTSGTSPSPKNERGASGFDGQARRGDSADSGSRRQGRIGLKVNTNRGHADELAVESFDGEEQTSRSAVWREFLVPVRLLQEKRVRGILFVYGVYSVRQ